MTDRLELGRVVGVFGVRGWIKVRSIAQPPEGILDYGCWWLSDRQWHIEEGRLHGELVAVKLAGVNDRGEALALRGQVVEVDRAALRKLKRGEFYWADVVGAQVETAAGLVLGTLSSLTSNGAQDVMVVRGERERLIPYVNGPIVKRVDVAARRIVVDWDPSF